jgi:hypothetical protein
MLSEQPLDRRFPTITKIDVGGDKPEYITKASKSNIIIEWINPIAIKGIMR